MELCTAELFIYVHSKVKPSMKKKCYNVIVKLIRESEDISAAACTCPAGSSIKKMKSCWCYSFVLEDFNRTKLKTFVKPLTCTSQLSKWNVPCHSSTNPTPMVKKTKFGDNLSTEVEAKK